MSSDVIKLDAGRIYLSTYLGTWRPYFCAGDSISATFGTAGYITSSGKDVIFIIPLSKPIIGNPTVTVTSVEGLMVRQIISICMVARQQNMSNLANMLYTQRLVEAASMYLQQCQILQMLQTIVLAASMLILR